MSQPNGINGGTPGSDNPPVYSGKGGYMPEEPNGIREKFEELVKIIIETERVIYAQKSHPSTSGLVASDNIKEQVNLKVADFRKSLVEFSTELTTLEERIRDKLRKHGIVYDGVSLENQEVHGSGVNAGIEIGLSLLQDLKNKYK